MSTGRPRIKGADTRESPSFRLDTVNECLWHHNDGTDAERIPLRPEAFAVLRYLVEQSGRLVSHKEITEVVWPDTSVQPEELKNLLFHIHYALGGESQNPAFSKNYRLILRDHTVKHFHVIWHETHGTNGELVEYVATAAEVTDRKRVAEERSRLRQLETDLAQINRVSILGQLAASLSHELKQPIAATVLNADACLQWLTRDQPDLREIRDAAQMIVAEGKRAAEIIERLRSLYKKSPPQRELVDVNAIIDEMVVLLRVEASRYGVSIRMNFSSDLPKIAADRVQLHQVFLNLMLNAIEAMNETGGVVTVKTQLGERGRVIISVSDTGVGLPAENVDQIFSAFFTTKPEGSGMGLAISRSIVESHGGCLWATANDGRGATFHLTLPTAAEATALAPAT